MWSICEVSLNDDLFWCVFRVIKCLCVTDRATWRTAMMSTIAGVGTNSAGRGVTTIGLENEKTGAETTGAIGEHQGINTTC